MGRELSRALTPSKSCCRRGSWRRLSASWSWPTSTPITERGAPLQKAVAKSARRHADVEDSAGPVLINLRRSAPPSSLSPPRETYFNVTAFGVRRKSAELSIWLGLRGEHPLAGRLEFSTSRGGNQTLGFAARGASPSSTSVTSSRFTPVGRSFAPFGARDPHFREK